MRLEDTAPVLRETAGFGVVSGCVIYVGGKTPPSDDDWQAYLDFLAPRLSADESTPRVVWDDSGGPSPVNRQKLVALTRGFPLKVAVVSQTRTVVTVLNWQHEQPAYREFPPEELEEAVAYVGIAGVAVRQVTQALRGMRRRLLGSQD